MRRKPAIYLVVILPILVVGGMFVIVRLMSYYAYLNGIPLSAALDKASMLIALPAFFIWIPLSLFISNLVLEIVPPLRKVARQYSSESRTPGFLASQFQLFMALVAISIVCVPLIIYGFMR